MRVGTAEVELLRKLTRTRMMKAKKSRKRKRKRAMTIGVTRHWQIESVMLQVEGCGEPGSVSDGSLDHPRSHTSGRSDDTARARTHTQAGDSSVWSLLRHEWAVVLAGLLDLIVGVCCKHDCGTTPGQ
jgi:hypothetical protein